MQTTISNHSGTRETRWTIFGGALALFVFFVVSNMAFDDAMIEQRFYCEMRETWIQTGGEYGWPENEIKDRSCPNLK